MEPKILDVFIFKIKDQELLDKVVDIEKQYSYLFKRQKILNIFYKMKENRFD